MSWGATMYDRAAIVIDLSTWAHRAYHASAATAPKGAAVNMLPVAASMLVKLLAERAPRFLVAAADLGGRTWRHELSPAYKAGRPPHPAGYDRQLVEVIRLFELHRIPVVGAEGHEADDVIAGLVRRFRRVGVPVVLLAADKDLRQLITDTWPGVIMWDGREKTITAQTIRDEMGVEPHRVGDLLALTGDDGDGVPGLHGVGPKKAAAMLAESRDLEHAITLRQWGSSVAAKALREGIEQVRLARRLVTLRDGAPIAVELQACALGGYDAHGLRSWYEANGLARLAARMEPPPVKEPVEAGEAEAWKEPFW